MLSFIKEDQIEKHSKSIDLIQFDAFFVFLSVFTADLFGALLTAFYSKFSFCFLIFANRKHSMCGHANMPFAKRPAFLRCFWETPQTPSYFTKGVNLYVKKIKPFQENTYQCSGHTTRTPNDCRQGSKMSYKKCFEYLRIMGIDGCILVVDDSESIDQVCYEIHKIGVNINQLAHWANANQTISEKEITKLKEYIEKLWQLQNCILSSTLPL